MRICKSRPKRELNLQYGPVDTCSLFPLQWLWRKLKTKNYLHVCGYTYEIIYVITQT